MKREGRQHGMVRTYRIQPSPLNPRPDTRFVNRFDSPSTAGLSTRVSSKPTNQSKFTGKCGKPRCNGCHMHPPCRAKDKTKGNRKVRSNDVVSNHKLLAFGVMDTRTRLNFCGVSATRILDQLSSYHYCDDEYSDCDGDDDHAHDFDGPYGTSDDNFIMNSQSAQAAVEINNAGDDQNQNGDEEDKISFCDVGFVVDQVEGDDDWCLVREM